MSIYIEIDIDNIYIYTYIDILYIYREKAYTCIYIYIEREREITYIYIYYWKETLLESKHIPSQGTFESMMFLQWDIKISVPWEQCLVVKKAIVPWGQNPKPLQIWWGLWWDSFSQRLTWKRNPEKERPMVSLQFPKKNTPSAAACLFKWLLGMKAQGWISWRILEVLPFTIVGSRTPRKLHCNWIQGSLQFRQTHNDRAQVWTQHPTS